VAGGHKATLISKEEKMESKIRREDVAVVISPPSSQTLAAVAAWRRRNMCYSCGHDEDTCCYSYLEDDGELYAYSCYYRSASSKDSLCML